MGIPDNNPSSVSCDLKCCSYLWQDLWRDLLYNNKVVPPTTTVPITLMYSGTADHSGSLSAKPPKELPIIMTVCYPQRCLFVERRNWDMYMCQKLERLNCILILPIWSKKDRSTCLQQVLKYSITYLRRRGRTNRKNAASNELIGFCFLLVLPLRRNY